MPGASIRTTDTMVAAMKTDTNTTTGVGTPPTKNAGSAVRAEMPCGHGHEGRHPVALPRQRDCHQRHHTTERTENQNAERRTRLTLGCGRS